MFYSGITGLQNEEVPSFLQSTNMRLNKKKMQIMFNYTYEVHTSEICQRVGDQSDGCRFEAAGSSIDFFFFHLLFKHALCS